MSHRVETDVAVNRFGFVQDDNGRRLIFPRGTANNVEGRSGTMAYGAGEAMIDRLEGRLGQLHWNAEGASFGTAWLRDDAGRIDMMCERIELSRGATLTKADRGVEINAPHVSLSEVRITVKGPFDSNVAEVASTALVPPPEQAPLRQGKLRFLDSLTGKINLTVKVKLDLPVVGKRTLDQDLRIPVNEGSLDFVKLEDSLDWLEGRFLDIKHDGNRLALTWKIPIVGSARDLISFQLDDDARNLASFGRVPVRSLADFRTKASKATSADTSKRQTLQALSLQAIDIALSLVAPRSVEAGGGMIMFGGDDSPGMVDLKVTGEINDKRPGSLRGAIGSIDTTIKDVRMGSATLAADRLHFDDLDELHVSFEGFTPVAVTMVVHRVTATNLNLQLGRE